MLKCKILATGAAVPKMKISMAETAYRTKMDENWVRNRTGIQSRYFATDETHSSLGADAAVIALTRAELEINEIDCIISASGTFQQPIPCNAALIQKEIFRKFPQHSSRAIPAFDVNTTCLSFLVALHIAGQYINSGFYKKILIVSAEIGSPGLDWQQPESASLIGDGAAAIILSTSEDSGTASQILGYDFETYSEFSHFAEIRGGGAKLFAENFQQQPREFLFDMNGPAIFRVASKLMPGFIQRLMEKSQRKISEVDWVVPHQASKLAMEILAKKLGFEREKIIFTLQKYGNTIAASIPMALDDGIISGKIQRGQKILLLGTSAGFSLGAMILDY